MAKRNLDGQLMVAVLKATKGDEYAFNEVRGLLEEGANPRNCRAGAEGRTFNNEIALIEISQQTPMMIAALNRNYEVVKLLKEKGDFVRPGFYNASLLVEAIENMLKANDIDYNLIKLIINEPGVIPKNPNCFCIFFDLMMSKLRGRNLDERKRILTLFMQCASPKQLELMQQYASRYPKENMNKGIQTWLATQKTQDFFGAAIDQLMGENLSSENLSGHTTTLRFGAKTSTV